MLLAFDISTSNIGFCSFNEDERYLVELDYIGLKNKGNVFEKFDVFKKRIQHYVEVGDVKYIGIEEPLKKFEGKHSTADTIAKLNFFNGMISSYLYSSFGIEPFYINVNTARSTAYPDLKFQTSDRKHEVWRKVVECEPKINWEYSKKNGKLRKENYDMSDAYTVGLAYLNILEERKKNENEEENK